MKFFPWTFHSLRLSLGIWKEPDLREYTFLCRLSSVSREVYSISEKKYVSDKLEDSRGIAYLVIIAEISALRRLIVAISPVTGQKIFTFPLERVDATLQVDVETGTIVDREGSLGRHVGVRRIQLMRQALLVYIQKAREVDVRLGHRDLL